MTEVAATESDVRLLILSLGMILLRCELSMVVGEG